MYEIHMKSQSYDHVFFCPDQMFLSCILPDITLHIKNKKIWFILNNVKIKNLATIFSGLKKELFLSILKDFR